VRERLESLLQVEVSRETFDRLATYVELLLTENERQNLIAPSTASSVWERHILDSAQLLPLGKGRWLDIGTGPGLPGLVIAILAPSPVTLCEPRSLRVQFLRDVVAQLGLANVAIVHGKSSSVVGEFDTITARAVASTDKLFSMARRLSHRDTVFVLPKGRSAQSELDETRKSWQGNFRLEPSATSADASILVASGVQPRGRS
jgi:16S rRNA (guanine527-N7)-methyltransferase